nr:YhgE/Pip domain-containing protein [Corynebacterium yudongzhengii]
MTQRAVWIIIIGVMITPALYSWVNIAALWDPYGNVSNIAVAVVNEDEGAESELTGELDIGEQVMTQLKDNDQLGWQFMDKEDAEEAVRRGDVFASLRLPEDFSQSFVDIFSATYSEPKVDYLVNEKLSAISPKITDQGSSAIESTISTAFKQQVANAVTTQLKEGGGEMAQRLGDASTGAADSFATTADAIEQAARELDGMGEETDTTRAAVGQAQSTLDAVGTTIDDAQTALRQVQQLTTDLSGTLSTFTASSSDALAQASRALSTGVASADSSAAAATETLRSALGQVDGAVSGATQLLDEGDARIAQLEQAATAAGAPVGGLDALKEQSALLRETLDDLTALTADSNQTLDSADQTAAALRNATEQTSQATSTLGDALSTSTPAITDAINRMGSSAGQLAGSLESQKTLLAQARSLLDDVYPQLDRVEDVVAQVQDNLVSVSDSIEVARGDILALGRAANDNQALNTLQSLDTEKVSTFLSAPVSIESHQVYPVNSYGSGMSSLFTNLSLWVGAFILLITFRAEVDTKGLEHVSVSGAYTGRFLLLATMAIGQALIVSIGNLAIGVQTVNAAAFITTCVLISLCYLSIIYGLVSTLGHVGRVIAVVLVFIQIPGASGLYPIEMTPDFFRALYPFLPFTYGISAMRETVGGFYSNQYVTDMAVLFGMAAVAYAISIAARRRLSGINMVVNQELDRGGLAVNEEVHTVGSKYRAEDLVAAWLDRDRYEDNIAARHRHLVQGYNRTMAITAVVGLAVLAGLMIASRFFPAEKALIFGLGCLVTLLAVATICLMEFRKKQLEHAQGLTELSDAEIKRELAAQSYDPFGYHLGDDPAVAAEREDADAGRRARR